jgi:hypothetical protein
MSIENEIAALTQSTTDLLDAVVTKKATLDTAVSNAQTAVTDATSQVSLAAAEKVSAQTARDEAETHKNQAYTYSQSAASAVAYQDLTAIAQTKAESAVDVFVYDTSKDSDGGAWRQRTQHTSWYNEPLNTATRGGRKEFPAVAVIVAETSKVTIYDGDDPSLPMWGVWEQGVAPNYRYDWWRSGKGDATAVVAKNGSVCFTAYATTYGGLLSIDFIADVVGRRSGDVARGGFGLDASSGSKNADLVPLEASATIVSALANDIAMTVLPDAPIDPATGLPIPTIAVATDGGVSVIKDDGTVVDSATTSSMMSVAFSNDGGVWYSEKQWETNDRIRYSYYDSDGFLAEQNYGNAPTIVDGRNSTNNPLLASSGLGLAVGFPTQGGTFNLLSPDYTTRINGAVAKISSTYNTGWMNGDIKLATLSDTDDTDLVGTELVTNGTFDSDTSGWTTGGTGVLSYSSGQMSVSSGTSDNGAAAQTISTVIGKTYVFEVTKSGDAGYIGVGSFLGDLSLGNSGTNTDAINRLVFKATSTTTYIRLVCRNAGNTTLFDNVSVRLAEPDRSVNGNGLQVFGTVTKEPVATGADLVGYIPTVGSRLEQPYNSDLDFGTGDFCYMGWGELNSASSRTIVSRQIPEGTDLGTNPFLVGFHVSTGSVRVQTPSGNFASGYVPPTSVTWTHVCAVRKDGVLYIYVNGELQSSHAFTESMDNPGAKVFVGSAYYNNAYTGRCKVALVKISGTAPTAEQIQKIYKDEKVLFQENAQATLHGTSDAVTALAYDDTTELLHVGTSAGRSVFQGLKRVDNTTDAVGVAISASNGLVVEE